MATFLSPRAFTVLVWLGVAGIVNPGIADVWAQSETQLQVQGTDGGGLNVRAEPDVLATVRAVAPEGATLTATGPELSSGGRRWRSVRTQDGVTGYAAAEYLVLAPGRPTLAASPVQIGAVASPVADPVPTIVPTPAPTRTPVPGPPLELEVSFKVPELTTRDEQTIYVDVFRGPVPQPGITVSFVVEDEDPEVERFATLTDEKGRSHYSWRMRQYKGTTVVHVRAAGPDGGQGKATKSFFVR